MPFSLEQLDFLSVHVGVAIPPAFIENKRLAEQFKKRSAEIAARSDEIKQRRYGAALEQLFKQATAAAGGKDFAAGLKLLDEIESGLAVPDAPPPEPKTAKPAEAPPMAKRDPTKDGAFVKLQTSRLQWDKTRDQVKAELASLEQVILDDVKQMNADPNEEFEFDLGELATKAKQLYTIMDKLDVRLLKKLDEALVAENELRNQKQKEAAAIVKEYQDILNSDPLVARIDNSGFMNTSIKQTFANVLNNLAKNL